MANLILKWDIWIKILLDYVILKIITKIDKLNSEEKIDKNLIFKRTISNLNIKNVEWYSLYNNSILVLEPFIDEGWVYRVKKDLIDYLLEIEKESAERIWKSFYYMLRDIIDWQRNETCEARYIPTVISIIRWCDYLSLFIERKIWEYNNIEDLLYFIKSICKDIAFLNKENHFYYIRKWEEYESIFFLNAILLEKSFKEKNLKLEDIVILEKEFWKTIDYITLDDFKALKIKHKFIDETIELISDDSIDEAFSCSLYSSFKNFTSNWYIDWYKCQYPYEEWRLDLEDIWYFMVSWKLLYLVNTFWSIQWYNKFKSILSRMSLNEFIHWWERNLFFQIKNEEIILSTEFFKYFKSIWKTLKNLRRSMGIPEFELITYISENTKYTNINKLKLSVIYILIKKLSNINIFIPDDTEDFYFSFVNCNFLFKNIKNSNIINTIKETDSNRLSYNSFEIDGNLFNEEYFQSLPYSRWVNYFDKLYSVIRFYRLRNLVFILKILRLKLEWVKERDLIPQMKQLVWDNFQVIYGWKEFLDFFKDDNGNLKLSSVIPLYIDGFKKYVKYNFKQYPDILELSLENFEELRLSQISNIPDTLKKAIVVYYILRNIEDIDYLIENGFFNLSIDATIDEVLVFIENGEKSLLELKEIIYWNE